MADNQDSTRAHEEVLRDTQFASRQEVVERLAYFKDKYVRFEPETRPADELADVNRELNRLERLAEKLAITDAEIRGASSRAESEMAKKMRRAEMVERAARAIVNSMELTDSEKGAMKRDPDFRRQVDMRVVILERERQE